MRRYLYLLILLCGVCGASPSLFAASAASAGPRPFIDRGRELFDFGRWADARHEFLAARGVLRPEQRAEAEEIDFFLAACAVELGSADAEGALKRFLVEHPRSTYNNDVRFALGSVYCSRGDMKQAREVFRKTDYKALSSPRREQYDIRMGCVEFAEGNRTLAYDYFNRIGARSKYADHALYYKSCIDYAEGRFGRARQGFEALAQSDAYRDLVPFHLLQLEFREGNYRYVVEQGESLVGRVVPERRAELERIIAESWFRLENFACAVRHLEAFRAAGGEFDRDAAYLMGFSLYRSARYGEAAEWLRKACGPEDALTQNASYHLADCCLRLGDKQAAMRAFALADDARFDAAIAEDALFNYAKLQYESGGGVFNGAIRMLTEYIERYPSSPRADEARTLLIAAYFNSRDYDAAYRAVKASSAMDAEVRAALQKIAYFRALEAYAAGDYAAAGRLLEESAAAGVSPKYTALGIFWQGEIAFAQGDYSLAAARYEAYLRRAPSAEREYALAWYNLGYCAFLRQRMSEADKSFRRFLELHAPSDRYRADACNRLGDIRYAAREFDAAIGEYDRAIALGAPEKAYAAYKRAMTLGFAGRTDEKLQALRRIAADPSDEYAEAASCELGRSCIAEERYAEGAAQLEKFLADYPSSPRRVQACSDLGLAWLNLGDRQKSLDYYGRVVAAAPRSAEGREALQRIRSIYVSEGDADGYFDYVAKAGLESDLTSISRDSLSFAAAQKLYLTNRHEIAARSLRSYLKSYPNGNYRVDALYFLSDCYLRLGQRNEAIATLSELAAAGANRYAPAVLDKLAAMTFADRRYDEAAAAYRRLCDAVSTAVGREEAMTGYVRATVATGDGEKIAAMAADVCAHPDAGATAVREARYAWAEELRAQGRRAEASELYGQLASEVRSAEGSAAAYRLLEEAFASGDMDRTEKETFAYSDRGPQAYWLAKAYLLLGDVYVRKGDLFQARATWQSIADGYSPSDDGIVAEAEARIRKLK